MVAAGAAAGKAGGAGGVSATSGGAGGTGAAASGNGQAADGGISEAAAQQRIKNYGGDWISALPEENKTAINSYTHTAYKNINATLRGISDQFDPGNYDCAMKIHESLENASLPVECTVYRGTTQKALGALQSLPDDMLPGKIISDRGFMSSSFDIDKARQFENDVLIIIEAPKGAHGVYVGSISGFGHSESEVLFDAGQVMKITGVERDGAGRRTIRVRIMI